MKLCKPVLKHSTISGDKESPMSSEVWFVRAQWDHVTIVSFPGVAPTIDQNQPRGTEVSHRFDIPRAYAGGVTVADMCFARINLPGTSVTIQHDNIMQTFVGNLKFGAKRDKDYKFSILRSAEDFQIPDCDGVVVTYSFALIHIIMNLAHAHGRFGFFFRDQEDHEILTWLFRSSANKDFEGYKNAVSASGHPAFHPQAYDAKRFPFLYFYKGDTDFDAMKASVMIRLPRL